MNEQYSNRRCRPIVWVALPALLLGLLQLLAPAASAASFDPGYRTYSYYVSNKVSWDNLNSLGCDTGNMSRNGRMTLFFGSPTTVDGTYGATLWGASNRTVDGVRNLVRAFVRGYDRCASGGVFLEVGVGISNCDISSHPGADADYCSASHSDSWVTGHGRAWGAMVSGLQSWAVNNGHTGRVSMRGAWDMEPGYAGYNRSENWMDGYDSGSGGQPLFANFSADGCPTSGADSGTCNNGYNMHRMWHLSWQHGPSWPVPQIYVSSQSWQWYGISRHGYYYDNGADLYFFGVLGARGYDTAPQARSMLLDKLRRDSHVNQADIRYTSEVNKLGSPLSDG